MVADDGGEVAPVDGGRPLLDQAADLFLVLVHGGSSRGGCGAAPERGRTLHHGRPYGGPGTQTAAHPPSTGRITPLMLLAASEARKTMAAACSLAWAGLPTLRM